jgi:hypothetical protein
MVMDEPAPKGKKSAHRRSGSSSTLRVTQSAFSPTSVRVANVGRAAVRVDIATKDGFPSEHADFAWNSLTAAVTKSANPDLMGRLARAETSEEHRLPLISYVSIYFYLRHFNYLNLHLRHGAALLSCAARSKPSARVR